MITNKVLYRLSGLGLLICGGLGCETKIDDAKLSASVTSMFKEQLSLEASSVDCPKGQTAKKDLTFECTVAVKPSGKVPVVVTVTDDEGTVTMKTKHNVLLPAVVTKSIQSGLDAKGIKGKADCGTEVRVATPSSSFDCTVEDAAGKHKVPVKLNDKGETSWEFQSTEPAAKPDAEAADEPAGDEPAGDEPAGDEPADHEEDADE